FGTSVSISLLGLLGINAESHPAGWTLFGVMLITCLGAMLVCATLGVVIERVAYRPLRNSPRLAPLISAIGVSLILEDVGKLWKGITYISFPQIFPRVNFTVASVNISSVNILVVVVSLSLMVGLQWLVTRTRIGRAMRAVA